MASVTIGRMTPEERLAAVKQEIRGQVERGAVPSIRTAKAAVDRYRRCSYCGNMEPVSTTCTTYPPGTEGKR